MASLRKPRRRADGTTAYSVLYILNGARTSATFDDPAEAQKFCDACNQIGPEKAMLAWGIAPTKRAVKRSTAPTVTEWLTRYIDSRVGIITKTAIYDYRSYRDNDIAPHIGAIPIDLLTRDDVNNWVQALASTPAKGKKTPLAGKTIANRHGFLSAALKVAVDKELIEFNPALGTKLPRTETEEMVFLDHDEYRLLRDCFTPVWHPMLDFMVASGARFGELTALRPADVNRNRGTVHIGRAWKRTYDSAGYELGPTKTRKSTRTIHVDADVLAALDYDREWLFVNTRGNPVRASSFRNNVWYPAVQRATAKGLSKRPRPHDMRHTCASWMIADGQPLPVIQAHLGHESIKTTVDRYGHLDGKSAAAAAASLGRALRRT